MFISLKANKKRIIAFLILVCVVVAACFFLKGKGEETKPEEPQEYFGATNEQRLAFVKSFGWEPEEKAIETREVMIPEEFNEVYTAYNDMQKAQGFDLKPYAGFKCMQYKYLITNYPDEREVYATLLVYDELILGGDLACAEVDGFMHGFAADSVRYGEAKHEKEEANESGMIEESQASSEAAMPEENAAEDPNAPAEDNGAENTENAGDNAAENPAEENADQGTEENANTEEETTAEIAEEAYPVD